MDLNDTFLHGPAGPVTGPVGPPPYGPGPRGPRSAPMGASIAPACTQGAEGCEGERAFAEETAEIESWPRVSWGEKLVWIGLLLIASAAFVLAAVGAFFAPGLVR